MQKRKSLLPPKFTPELCRDAGGKYLNYEAYDEGSLHHLKSTRHNLQDKKDYTHLRFNIDTVVNNTGKGTSSELNLN